MTITTKFKVGDSAFAMYENKVHEVVVTGVYAFHEFEGDHFNEGINYRVRFEAGGETKVSEDRLYATKLSLINAL